MFIDTVTRYSQKSENPSQNISDCSSVFDAFVCSTDVQLKCEQMLLSSLLVHFWRSECMMQVGHVTDGRLWLVCGNPATTRVTSQPHDSITVDVSN